ncbi:MAG TPA: metal-dependent hydrolase [Polyangiaceae bacterium]|jgi:inner membrane protein|nr:metal-dependent hydrolase [Polyangiaceae bacterium]
MDTLTHGLLGLSIGAIRKPDGTPTDRGVLLAAVIAAELPDLDYLWPSDEPVLVTLRAHRGLSHALIAAPGVALVAAVVACLVVRRAAFLPTYVTAVAATVFGHILCDLWTGWGTRVLLPLSDRRLGLDWTSVVDPLVTLPLLIGAGIALARRRRAWRRPLLVGLLVSAAYVGARVGIRAALEAEVDARYGAAARVFPAPVGVLRWRYVAPLPNGFAAGVVELGGDLVEERVVETDPRAIAAVQALPVGREVLAWARFPVVTRTLKGNGGYTLSVGDLRYHAGGEPTLRFVLEVDAGGQMTSARLDRGGSLRELVARWWR